MAYDDDKIDSVLSANGWERERRNPLELRHHESGATATKIAAEWVVDRLMRAAGFTDPMAELCALQQQVASIVRRAQKAGERDVEKYAHEASWDGNAREYEAWKIAFDLVFNDNVSGRARALLNEMNQSMDYYDPDGSYQDDVTAYATALKEKVERLSELLM